MAEKEAKIVAIMDIPSEIVEPDSLRKRLFLEKKVPQQTSKGSESNKGLDSGNPTSFKPLEYTSNVHTPEETICDVAYIRKPSEHDSASHSFKAFKEFKEALIHELHNNTLGLSYKSQSMPESRRRALVTAPAVKRLLPTANVDEIRWLVDKASILLCVTILALSGYDDLFTALRTFYNCRVDDSHLPIENPASVDINPQAFAGEPWDLSSRRTFYKEQWAFVIQKFSINEFTYENIEDDRILPFIVDVESLGTLGNFSNVYPVWMLQEYMHLDENNKAQISGQMSRNESRIRVALKSLRPIDEGVYDMEQEWRKEVNAHRALNALHHQNIVKAIGAFHQSGTYHLLLEWANGGNLRTFWSQNRPKVNSRSVLELLKQLLGLLDALSSMHSGRPTQMPLPQSSPKDLPYSNLASTAPQIVLEVEDGKVLTHRSYGRASQSEHKPQDYTRPHWRHGDIKPENILRFVDKDDDPSSLGTLKIADLGRAKFHSNETTFRQSIEIDPWHTKRYEPPDLIVGHGTKTQSRLYDVWSMGAVMLESIVWLVYGSEGQSRMLEDGRNEAAMSGTPFWTKRSKGAVISQPASMVMSSIRSHPVYGEGSALGDTVKLILEQMLVVDLPTETASGPGFRASADDCLMTFNGIVARAVRDQDYLLRGGYVQTIPSDLIPRPPLFQASPKCQIKATIVDLSLMKTEPRPSLPHQQHGPGQHRRKISRSKSFSGPSSSRGFFPAANDAFNLQLGKLNHLAMIKTNMTTHFTHSLRDTWHYEDDSAFSEKTLQTMFEEEKKLRRQFFPDQEAELCDQCLLFDPTCPESFGIRLISDLRDSSEYCDLCELLVLRTQKAKLLSTHEISITREGGLLKINNRPDMQMRVCRSPGMATRLRSSGSNIPLGMPKLDRPGKPLHIKLLKRWLEDCQEHHNCVPSGRLGYCPKRLLDLGTEVSPQCKLVETRSLGENRHYITFAAFSHPWGREEDDHRHLKSTKANSARHAAAIEIDQLPVNYKDAIRICRAVGMQYLWIDSLCILQAADGDPGDFKDEAAFIQDIFSSANFVVAASSAQGTSSGFLDPRKKSHLLALPIKDVEDGHYYISNVLDDFEKDVLDGPLNERGWVMQERALARRTIFFTTNQTYFECGNGVRCETLSKLQCDRAAFLGDADFPTKALTNNIGAQTYLIAALFEQYSALKFTRYTDKAIAISGMELRLTNRFGIRSGAGVFQRDRGRWLLWERASDTESLERVVFPDDKTVNTPPSWSFMAYIGGITYMLDRSSQMTWNSQLVVKLTGDASRMWLYSDSKLEMQSRILTLPDASAAEIVEVNMVQKSRAERAQNDIYMTYDARELAKELVKTFILVGTLQLGVGLDARYYVLAVRQIDTGYGVIYERVGAGWLPKRLVDTGWEPWPHFTIV